MSAEYISVLRLECEICQQFGQYEAERLRVAGSRAAADGWEYNLENVSSENGLAFCPIHANCRYDDEWADKWG